MGILNKTKCYLAGAIQYSDGFSWRNKISKELKQMGIIPFNPLEKPFIASAPEDKSTHKWLKSCMERGDLTSVKQYMTKIRRYDFAMLDSSQFVIAHIIPKVSSWGTATELDLCERVLKPAFICVEGGIKQTPYWLLSMFDESCFYSSFEEILEELKKLDSGEKDLNEKYWRLFHEEYR